MRNDPNPQAPSLAHLVGRLEVVAQRVRAACDLRRASDPDPLDRFRGLHISAAQVERLLSEPPAALLPDPEATLLLQQVEHAADAAEAAGCDLRLRRLCRDFGLDELDLELLLVALAPDLDARFERLYGYLQDDVSRRRPSIGLWLELCGLEPALGEAWRRLAGQGPLLRWRLLLVEDPDRPFLTRSMRVPDRVAAHLLGDDSLDPALAALACPSYPEPGPGAESLGRSLGAGVGLAYLRERPGTAAAGFGVAALERAGRECLVIDLRRLRPEDDPTALGALLGREARLRRAGLVAGPVEVLASRGPNAVAALAQTACPTLLFGGTSWDPAWSQEVPLLVEVPAPDRAQLGLVWKQELDGATEPGLDPAGETASFRLTPAQVRRAARAAALGAATAGRAVGAADLRLGARAQNAAGLERLARRIEPAVFLADLVLPNEVVEQLRDLVARAHHRQLVLGEWRMAGPASRRRGLTALFAGPSGTGKTMAAEVLAGEMGLDLYVVDLASVVDKYVGETEKNLDRIFAEAESVNGVLLFDEADALFGKRSEVSDAHDRYANVEVAYLLQRMELFEGIAILATNLRSNLDEAFARRLDMLIDFPEPDQNDRLRLWRACLGASAPLADDLDLEFLARSFKLSGGNIRNIVLSAAYTAAEGGRAIAMADLVRATQREYRKLGRMVVESEFGPWLELLARV